MEYRRDAEDEGMHVIDRGETARVPDGIPSRGWSIRCVTVLISASSRILAGEIRFVAFERDFVS